MSCSYKQPISVLVVVYTRQLDVLLLQRADDARYWQSVTGSCEQGETLIETAARELFEETGLMPEHGHLQDWQQQNRYEIFPQWRHRYPVGVTENTEHVFGFCLDEVSPIKIAPREHLAYLWQPWQLAATQVFSPSNRAAIQIIPQYLDQ